MAKRVGGGRWLAGCSQACQRRCLEKSFIRYTKGNALSAALMPAL